MHRHFFAAVCSGPHSMGLMIRDAGCRETEASANLSLTLTGVCLALLIIVRAWGLALAEVDDLRTKYGVSNFTDPEPPKVEAKVE